MSERFLTISEGRKLANVSRTTFWRWCNERGLTVVRVGRVTRIRETDLMAFLKRYENCQTGTDLKA